MKKHNLKLLLFALVLSSLYLLPRLYKFSQKTIFSLDQGIHLLESYKIVQNKSITLIGPSASKNFQGRQFFIGSQYYYILGFLGILFNWDLIYISIFLLLFEYTTIIVFCIWVYKKRNLLTSLLIFLFLCTNNYLIINSRFIWNPHFLLPLSVLAVMSIDIYLSKRKIIYFYFFFFLWGLAFSFHYSAIFWIIPVIYFLLKTYHFKPNNKIFLVPVFIFLGNLPIVIFELRHNFYNIKTIFFILKNSQSPVSIELHYIVYPLIVFFITLLLLKINNKFNLFIILFLINLISYIFFKPLIPHGQSQNWNYLDVKKSFQIILSDGCPKDFNIASTVSGDTRSYDIRFLLIKNKCPPMDVDQYLQTNTLFLVAPKTRPPESEKVWEVDSIRPFNIIETHQINQFINLYRLERQSST